MSRRQRTASIATDACLLPKWHVEIEMSDGSKGRHEAPYADAFRALEVAKRAFPQATRITVTPAKKANHA
jgi:hypothetical protein